MLKSKLLGATAAAEPVFIEDVFSTYLYTGTGSAQTITNGIDLAGEGGLVWSKSRSVADNHRLTDTERGANKTISTDAAFAEYTNVGVQSATQFNSDGFVSGLSDPYFSGQSIASWTFRKAPRFFDVVTYTGTGSARTVDHNLGTTVGSIIIKRTDTTSNWAVYHRGNTAAPETDFLSLNLTNATADNATYWNDTAPTDSVFTVGTNAAVNASGGTYVAYLFAHDPLGPSGDGSDGLIACGSYTGSNSATVTVNLGWEPQWVLIKRTDSSSSPGWWIGDVMRGLNMSGITRLEAQSSNAESAAYNGINPTATGFDLPYGTVLNDANTSTYIYIAIRRGPMREPTSGTEVFAVDNGDGSSVPAWTSGFPVDMAIERSTAADDGRVASRLTSGTFLITNSTAAETANSFRVFDYMNGWLSISRSTSNYSWMFRRAPGFFDVVAYTGDGVAGRTVPHNLGVAPEMMIVKNRGDVRDWIVYHKDLGATYLAELNTTAAAYQNSSYWPSVPTDSVFSPGNASATNRSGYNHIAYLFATLPGVSKVGSYTGNGSSQTINCGFTGGARFVLIKRTDSTGDWYVWDTARGIVAGNDPHLSLNTTAAEVTTNDSIDPDSSGFIVNQVAATNINVSSASYIYLAIA